MRRISVVVPVYYNAESLPLLYQKLTEIEAALAERSLELELIFVDDGSGDDSLKALLKIKQDRPATKVIKLTRNFGAVSASKTGMQFVTGNAFMLLAADLQDPPALILEMVDKWLNGSKFVICVRTGREDPGLSKLFSAVYYKLVSLMVVKDYPSGGFDMALMDEVLLPHMKGSSKNINPQLYAYWLGIPPDKLHYHRPERMHGRSRWNFSKRVKYLIDSLLGFSVIPIRLISATGFIVSVLSFLFGTSIVINRILGNIPEVPGYAAMTSLISFLLGLTLTMLGIIGEYVWRIFDEINKKPESVIEEIF